MARWTDRIIYSNWNSCKVTFICRRRCRTLPGVFYRWTSPFKGSLFLKYGKHNFINKWYTEQKESVEEEKVQVIAAAATFIKSEQWGIQFKTDVYPSKTDTESEAGFLSPALKLLMECLMEKALKQDSLSQCIIKAMKQTSVIPPLLFRLCVEIDYATGSKSLLAEILKLGYGILYEVKQYKNLF